MESVFNGAFRRSVFEDAGAGLYKSGRDHERGRRAEPAHPDAGGRVYLSREIVVHYLPRDRPDTLARQYFKYGQGRARTLLKHRRLLSIRPVIPFFMVAAGALLLATSPLHRLTPFAFGAYAALTLAEAVRVGRHGGPRQISTVWGIFPLLHLAHGVGFAAGLVHYLRHPDWGEPERIPARAAGGVAAGAGR